MTVPTEWQNTWAVLREASGLAEEDFESFVRNCDLDFGCQYSFGLESATTLDQKIVANDIERITNQLFEVVANPEQVIELSREQLLRRLNWTDRFELKSQHQFPVDESLYQPIEVTAQELGAAIDELPGGYIAVIGSPGSGKSILLSQTLRTLNHRLISYYAYVPEAAGATSLRGEAVNFLHDVVLQLDRAGFRVDQSPSSFDREQLLSRFHKQLELLRRDRNETDSKTIILIDGLDHIDRELHPQYPLLADLPDPGQVPDGVYFVLGTQTVGPIPSRIQAAARQQGRMIQMQPLRRQQVFRMIRAANLAIPLTHEQEELAYQLSDGHPLYVNYLINRMTLSESSEQLDRELREGERFEGDIEETYHTYWEQFADDEELVWLLGMVARVRRVIDLSWVRTWCEEPVIERLGRRFAHYFRRENSTQWYFFHNSFRLFLLETTAEFPPGTADPHKDRGYHIALGYICSKQPEGSAWAWEELFHRASGEQHSRVLELATQGYFRSQFFALRPSSAIRTDTLIALRSAAFCADPVALARLCLIGSEMTQRNYYLEQVPYVLMMAKLGYEQAAVDHICAGNQLLVDSGTALKAAVFSNDLGFESEARRIFEIAEPFDLFPGNRALVDLTEDSVRAALSFQQVGRVIDTIRQLSCQDDDPDAGDDGSPAYSLQSRMLSVAAQRIL